MTPRLLAVLALAVAAAARGDDAFDRYTNPVLAQVPGADGVKDLKQATANDLLDADRVLTGVSGAVLVVRTNDDRWAKLVAQPGKQRVGEGKTIPTLFVERFVTFKEGTDQTVVAGSRAVALFPGFRLSLDLGQVVPEPLAADLRFVVDGDKSHLEPLGKAKLYLLTKPLPLAAPKKGDKVVVGARFEAKLFNGTYRLFDDGRRTATLTLRVAGDGDVSGSFVSDKDGAKYEVCGRVGPAEHAVEFAVTFPRSEQIFKGFLFTGDAKALVGSSKIGGRETGFYALRVEE